jgi:hypothetical protein
MNCLSLPQFAVYTMRIDRGPESVTEISVRMQEHGKEKQAVASAMIPLQQMPEYQ